MAIAPGSRLGPYEIVASIGAGGMGEVYRAIDTRLDRTVAVKVLSPQFAGTPELRERFQREARAISSLSHPHICALYDVGHQDGVDFLVMEFMEGTTLAERLLRGPLPLDQVLRLGQQIADALHHAHRQGITHRDLKPGNIMITKSGAKLLDFGLAKARVAVQTSADGTTRIEQAPLTQEGTLLGTVPYMAPEQLEGQVTDSRTDIFALGAVLYEMTTGRRAFAGRSTASLIASILSDEPPAISSVQPLTPPALERLVRICMAKDPDARRQTAHDVAADLKWIAEGNSGASIGIAPAVFSRRFLWIAAAALIGIAAGAALMRMMWGETAPSSIARLTINADPPVHLDTGEPVTISPNGQNVVFAGLRGGKRQLYVRALAGTQAMPIPGTEDAYCAAFSPDGKRLAFSSNGKLLKVSLDGSSRTILTDNAGTTFGIQWQGDRIYYNQHFGEGIWFVPSSGGEATLVARPDSAKGVRALLWPHVLPGGKTMLAAAWNTAATDPARIVAINIETGQSRVILDSGSYPRYLPTGHLLFSRGGAIFAVPFDLDKLEVRGSPIAVVNGVSGGVSRGDSHFAVSPNGTLIFVPGQPLTAARELLWVTRDGKEEHVVRNTGPYSFPAVSPDSRMIAVTLEHATFNIWKLDARRGSMTRLSFGGTEGNSVWMPDGSGLVFDSARTGVRNLYRTSTDGSGDEERLTDSTEPQHVSDVSPDGKSVLFSQLSPSSGFDLWLLPLTSGDRKPRQFLATRFGERSARFSPDGRWVTYLSNESGREELYVRPFPGPGGRWQVSIDGAAFGLFAGNGEEILYRKGNTFYAVPVKTGPPFEVGQPQLLFERNYAPGWTCAPDGQRLLVMRGGAVPVSKQISIVLNWFDDLQRRVPVNH